MNNLADASQMLEPDKSNKRLMHYDSFFPMQNNLCRRKSIPTVRTIYRQQMIS